MTGPFRLSTRVDMASRVFHGYRWEAREAALPADEYRTEDDVMASLICAVRHYPHQVSAAAQAGVSTAARSAGRGRWPGNGW